MSYALLEVARSTGDVNMQLAKPKHSSEVYTQLGVRMGEEHALLTQQTMGRG